MTSLSSFQKSTIFHKLTVCEAKNLLENRTKVLSGGDYQSFIFSGELRGIGSDSLSYSGTGDVVYGIRLYDRGDSIELVLGRKDSEKYRNGAIVRIHASPQINVFQWKITPQLLVYRIEDGTAEDAEEQEIFHVSTLELLKKYKTPQNSFPTCFPVKVSVISPSSSKAQVLSDFKKAIEPEKNILLTNHKVRFNNSREIVMAINKANAIKDDILVIIRGGW